VAVSAPFDTWPEAWRAQAFQASRF